MCNKKKHNTGKLLRRLGFDATYYNRSTGYYKVKCSQCDALVINGVPCHESGCPNKPENDEEDY